MSPRLPDNIRTFMQTHGVTSDEIWPVPGGKSYAIKHSALERIAAEKSITFKMPQIVEKDSANGIATVLVEAVMGDFSTWSFGEASPRNNKNAYCWSMAEKRAKDRCILKLLNAHGAIYSEDEADDFKQRASHNDDAPRETDAQAYVRLVRSALKEFQDDPSILHSWWLEETPHREQHGIVKGTPEFDELVRMFAHKKDQLLTMKEAAE